MTIIFEERSSDSPYVESITHGWTLSDGTAIRPAESRWHMVVVRQDGTTRVLVVGPWTSSGVVTYTADAELIWIRLRLGIFMPHLPTRDFLDSETILPGVTSQTFWLHNSAWHYPDNDNVDTFVDRLVRHDVLASDPVISAVLEDHPLELAPRTIRHRFLRATGLTQSHIFQIERAQRAAALLRQGLPIPDAMFEMGYFDQPHLTRSLKQWVGHTPGQLIRMHSPA
jgi:hypothetical protein